MRQLVQSGACIRMIDIDYHILYAPCVVIKWGDFFIHTPRLIHLNLSGMTV